MLTQFLSSMDIFGVPGILYISGKETSKCRFGGVCSLLFSSFVIWALYTGIKELSSTSNPQTVESELQGQDAREFLISPSTFPISIRVNYISSESKTYRSFIDPRIYNITVGVRAYNYGQYLGIEKVQIEKCLPKHLGDMYSAFASPDLENSFCIAQDQVSIQGVFGSPIYRDLIILIYQCDNATMNGNCAPQEEIDERLKESWFTVVYGNMVIDPNNYSDPDRRYLDYYAVMLSQTTSQNTTIKLRHLNVLTDSAWLGESWSREEFVRVNEIRENSAVKGKNDTTTPMLGCLFEMSLLETNYRRSYMKIQTAIAEVAGLVNTALACFVIIISGYLRLKVNETMMNELFDINIDSKVLKKKTKGKNKEGKNNQQLDLNASGDRGKLKAELSSFEKSSNELPENREDQNLSVVKHSETTSPGHDKKENRNDVIHGGKEGEIAPKHPKVTRRASRLKTFSDNTNEVKDKNIPSRRSFGYSERDLQKHQLSHANIEENTRPSFLHEERRSLEALNKRGRSISDKKAIVKVEMKILEEPEVESYDYENSILIPGSPLGLTNIKEIERNHKTEEKPDEKVKVSVKAQAVQYNEKGRQNRLNSKSSMTSHRNYNRIRLSFWEYLLSFIYQSKELKHKMYILDEGQKNISLRLDVLQVLKKMREVDKIKALFFDKEQLILFNHLPKPVIGLTDDDLSLNQPSLVKILTRKGALTEEVGTEQETLESYKLIKHKENKTELDRKLLDVFDESLHSFEDHRNILEFSPKDKASFPS